MKTVYLVRHASAEERETSQKDVDRTLSEKGREEARQMGKLFRDATILPELWISSQAQRALQTAYIFAEVLNYSQQNIQVNNKIYDENSGSRFLTLLNTLNEKAGSCIIFGHEPTLSECAALLIRQYHFPLPKAGILGIVLPTKKWQQIESGNGLLKMVLFPQSEKLAREILKKTLATALFEKNLEILQLLDKQTAKDIQDSLTRHSDKMAKKFIKRLEQDEEK
jgi:phosphohistidine phosphatase